MTTSITDPQSLLIALRAALINVAFAPLNTALTNIIANPSTQNVLAQATVAEANLMVSGPALEQAGISDVAQLLQAKLAAIKALATAASAPASPAAAGSGS